MTAIVEYTRNLITMETKAGGPWVPAGLSGLPIMKPCLKEELGDNI